jgi:hypothetical protein
MNWNARFVLKLFLLTEHFVPCKDGAAKKGNCKHEVYHSTGKTRNILGPIKPSAERAVKTDRQRAVYMSRAEKEAIVAAGGMLYLYFLLQLFLLHTDISC